jgi:DNA-binding MarR family transcriptional regulator
MSDKRLSKNEQLVLYGLVKLPLLNDRELAEKLKLNISTLTAIKNRLKKKEYYMTVRIPMLHNIGCELMGVAITKLNLTLSDEERLKMEEELGSRHPEAVFMLIESDFLFTILMAKNFTELKNVLDEIRAIVSNYNALEEQDSFNFFYPFQTTRILNFFDFAPIIQRGFGIKDDKKKEPKFLKVLPEPKKLTRIEKLVFYGLIKYPDLPDKKIAEYTNVTRQVVARLRKDFEKEELMRTVRIPNLKMLDFQILGFAYAKINPQQSDPEQDARKKGIAKVYTDIPTIFWASGNYESIILSVFKDFDDYKDLYIKGFGVLQKYNFFEELPEPHSLSVNYANYLKNHDYAPLVKKIFDITEME